MTAPPRLAAGVDGGGSRTRCWVAAADGTWLGRGEAGPSNWQVTGPEGTRAAVQAALGQALAAAGLAGQVPASLFAGLAGVGHPPECRAAEEALGGLAERVRVDNDAVCALAAGTLGGPGVVVIAGTGSIAYGMDGHGRTARAGGWGYLLGDEGSGYDLGRRALVAALRAADGRGPATALAARLQEVLALQSWEEVVPRVYRGDLDRPAIAALAPLVVETAAAGDPLAGELVQSAAAELALAAATVARRLALDRAGQPVPVVAAGGLLQPGRLATGLQAELERHLPHARLRHPVVAAAGGALLLALGDLAGPAPAVSRRLLETAPRVQTRPGPP